MSDPVEITSGSDGKVEFSFKQKETGAVIPVTSPVVIEQSGGLADRCSAVLKDGPNGLVTVEIEGTVPIVVGTYFLRVQVVVTDGTSLASPRVVVNVV
jgi:hypothetical protein